MNEQASQKTDSSAEAKPVQTGETAVAQTDNGAADSGTPQQVSQSAAESSVEAASAAPAPESAPASADAPAAVSAQAITPMPAPAAAAVQADAPAPADAPAQQSVPVVHPMPPAPMRPAKQQKKTSPVLIVGIIVCVIAVAALIFSIVFMTSQQRAQEDLSNLEPPSQEVVEEAYKSSNIASPNFSSYSYINTANLGKPEVTDVTVGTVTVSANNNKQTASCDTTATATFKNDDIEATEPVTMRLTYNTSESKWEPGSVQGSQPKVTPTGPADVAALEKAVPSLLKEYDEDIANQFTDCDITSDPKLTAEGGTVKFTLAKTDKEKNVDKKCDVDIKLAWNDEKGWDPTIEKVSDITETPIEGKTDSSSAASSSSSSSSSSASSSSSSATATVDPDMLLVCRTGELVEVPGTIEYQNDRVLLKADNTIRVELDGKVYVAKYFEIIANSFVVTVGSHVAAIGEISATGVLTQAPLAINLDYA